MYYARPMRHALDSLQDLARRCADAGFDLCAWARVGAYNERLREHAGFLLPELGDPGHAVVLIGNTQALWPAFTAALRTEAELRAAEHPLDGFCRARIGAAASQLAAELGVEHVLRHASDAPPRGVAMQQLAEVTGAVQTGPCRLSVHPLHGPWVALRAALVLAIPAPPAPWPRAAPCEQCPDRPCLVPFERALSRHGAAAQGSGQERVAAHYAAWLAVRDACPVGRASRYGQAQLDYHYLKDRRALLRSLGRDGAQG